jgi:hypothetical protein
LDGGDSAGGSRELAQLIDQYGEFLVADLKRYYQIDLRDIMKDGSGLSPRLVLCYVRALPLESATVAAMRGGDQFRGWNQELYMLANLLDAVRENTYAFVAANSKKKPKAPEPVQRPEKQQKKKTSLFAAMARAEWRKGRTQ